MHFWLCITRVHRSILVLFQWNIAKPIACDPACVIALHNNTCTRFAYIELFFFFNRNIIILTHWHVNRHGNGTKDYFTYDSFFSHRDIWRRDIQEPFVACRLAPILPWPHTKWKWWHAYQLHLMRTEKSDNRQGNRNEFHEQTPSGIDTTAWPPTAKSRRIFIGPKILDSNSNSRSGLNE